MQVTEYVTIFFNMYDMFCAFLILQKLIKKQRYILTDMNLKKL